ncbi:hypothetical protein BEL05_12050 [Shewanella colwelliana]|uniref:Uncharacterized protein n=1 Tax=Shewanella colwelliana TaxID=23 RepID=A0A1E5IWJ7_SHECO|nr:hypothetical protein [Shewanella colwelliana]OEG74904.1 hypothetical protein BEL05_12050 [Shewanella colwelliana]
MAIKRLLKLTLYRGFTNKQLGSAISIVLVITAMTYSCKLLAMSTRDAILNFKQDTNTIVEQSHRLSKQHARQMELLSQKLDETQSAKIVLQSEFIGDMTQTAEQMLALANQYLPHYQHFLANIDKDSDCYQPEQLAQFQQTTTELQDYVDNIDSLLTTRDEAEAFSALMAFNLGQTQVNMLVDMFEVSKFCYLSEALPPLVEDVQSVETELVEKLIQHGAIDEFDHATSQTDRTRAPEPQSQQPQNKSVETLTLSYEFTANDLPYFNDLSTLEVSDISELKQLTLTNQLRINDQLQLQLPDAALADISLPYQARITGVVETDNERITLDILLIRSPSYSIDAMSFNDPQIASCIKASAKQLQLTNSNELTQLNCRLSSTVNLDDLQKFKQLQTVSLMGGKLTDLSPLSSLAQLEMLNIELSQIAKFGDISRLSANLMLSNIDTQDWQALAQSQATSVSIMNITDCSRLAPLAHQPNVALMYKGLNPNEIMALMQQVDKSNRSLTVLTDCPAPKN